MDWHCQNYFRFTKEQLALLAVPSIVRLPNGRRISHLEALCIFLRAFSTLGVGRICNYSSHAVNDTFQPRFTLF